jgi:hypothetical protein
MGCFSIDKMAVFVEEIRANSKNITNRNEITNNNKKDIRQEGIPNISKKSAYYVMVCAYCHDR